MAVIGWLVAIGLTLLAALANYAVSSVAGSQNALVLWFAPPVAIVAVGVALCGWGLHRRGHFRVAYSVMALALTLAAYAALTAAPVGLILGRSAAAPWLISAAGGWHMMPILLCGIASLVAAETLIGRPGALRAAWPIPAFAVVIAWLTGLGSVTSADFPQVSPPLAATLLGAPAARVTFGVSTAAWMLSTTVAPLLIIAMARRASGLRRGRLTILATAAATPILTIVTSAVLLVAFVTRQLPSEPFADVILTGAFLVATLVVAIGIFAACTARDDGVTGRIGTTARWVLRLLWLVIGAELTAVLAAVLGGGSGTPSSIAVSTVAVVLTIGFVAAYQPVAGRLEAFMTVGPTHGDGVLDDAAGTSPESMEDGLAGLLSPRERDVLALIAQGRSNAAIAGELFLSERTIDSHISSIFEKLGLGRDAGINRRVQAAAAWIRADLARDRYRSSSSRERRRAEGA